jgi:D-alanyl-D-alanine-carboxypeptidase/D-alanyl-D-alanine-endopeptidase
VRRLRLALAGGALALPLTALSAGAQRPAERQVPVGDLEFEPSALELVEGFVESLLEERLTRGLVVGVSTASEQWVGGYGVARDDRPGAPHGDTRFELGSITKVFTGLLLTEAVARDEVALDTPLSSLLPEGIKLK